MPNSLARPCVQGNQTISEEVVADTIGAVEIKRGRTCWDIDNAAPGIECHSGPIVRGPAGLPRILRPSVIAKFTGMRDGVERPAQPTGSSVVGANVAGRRRESLRVAAAEYYEVLVNDAWAGQINRLSAGRFAAQVFAEIDSAAVSKRWIRPSNRSPRKPGPRTCQ